MPQRGEVAFELRFRQLQTAANFGSWKGSSFLEQLQDPLLNIGQLPGLAAGIPGSVYRPGITRDGLYLLLQETILAQRFTSVLIGFRGID